MVKSAKYKKDFLGAFRTMNLKNGFFRLFFLPLLFTLAFSFSYEGIAAVDCNPNRQDCDGVSSDNTRWREIGEEDELIRGLKPYFTQNEEFKNNMSASRSFDNECKSEYPSFRSSFESYSHADPAEDSVSHYIEEIKRSAKACANQVHKNYFDFLKNIEQKYESQFVSYSHVKSIFDNNPSTPTKNIQQFREHLLNIEKLNDCVTAVQSSGGDFEEISAEANIGHVLKQLWQKNCYKLRTNLEKIYHRQDGKPIAGIAKQFFDRPALCARGDGCVATLKNFVGLNPPMGKDSFFHQCANELNITQKCCSSTECEHVPESKQAFQAMLASHQNSEQENICQSKSSQAQSAQHQMANKMYEFCKTSVEKCANNCQSQLLENKGFKEAFLKCFFLPKADSTVYKLHGGNGNTCRDRIKEIADGFAKQAKMFVKNQNQSVEMEGFLANQGSSYITDTCKIPWKNLEKNKIAMKNNVWSKACHERNQMANGNWVNPNQSPGGSGGGRDTSTTETANSPNPGSYSGGNVINPGGSFAGPGQGNDKDNLDPRYFPQKAKSSPSPDDGDDDEDDTSKTDTEKYTGPPDPFKARSSRVSSNSSGVGSLSSLSGELGSEGSGDGKKGSSEEDAFSQGSSRKPASYPGASMGSSSDSRSSGSGSRSFMRRMLRPIKEAAKSAYKAAFGDPTKTVKNVFNVNGSEVNLLDRQKELAQQFCKLHQTCGNENQ